jgi:hypothetical protein
MSYQKLDTNFKILAYKDIWCPIVAPGRVALLVRPPGKPLAWTELSLWRANRVGGRCPLPDAAAGGSPCPRQADGRSGMNEAIRMLLTRAYPTEKIDLDKG